jgi:cellulose synthase operon protein C
LAATQTKLMAGRGAALAQITIKPDATARPRPRPTETTAPAKQAAAPASAAPKSSSSASSDPAPTASASGGSGCRSLSEKATSAARLAERGWCAYNLDRPMDALAAFKSAEPRLSGTQRRDVRFGMALSYLKMDMTEEASRIAASTQLTRQQRVDTESIILNQRGVRAYKKKQYRKAIGYFDALEQISGHLRRDLAILRGYAYLNGGNVTKARSEFQALHDQLATPETRAALKAAGG